MRRYIIHVTLLIRFFLLLCLSMPNFLYGSVDSPARHDTVLYTPMVDSLLNLIKTASGPELLKLYPRLHKALYEVNDIDVHLRYNTDFAEAARAANDKKAEAISHVLKVEALYNYRMPDSILLAESLKALDFMRDVPGAEVHYFYTASVVSDIYMLAGDYEKALAFAEQFYNEAKKRSSTSGLVASLQTMGKAYEELDLPDKAEVSFRESIAVADEKRDHGMKGESYSFLVDMLNGQGLYDKALQTNKEFEAYLNRIDACNGELKNLCFLNDLGYATSYTKLGQYDLAWRYLLKAEKFPVADTGMGMYSVENERFGLLFAEGRYAEAEQSLNRLEEILGSEASYFKASLELQEARAELYYCWGKHEKSADLYREYIAGKDSLQRVEMTARLHAIRTQFEVDKLEMQKAQQQRSFHHTILWFSAVLVLLCLLLAIGIINHRRLRDKNRSLLQRIREHDRQERENEEMRGRLLQGGLAASAGENGGEEENGEGTCSCLYLRLRELMKDPSVFTNPGINRKTIAEHLGTNEKYVYDTIKKYYGTSVSDYINQLRLNYARSLLGQPHDPRSVEEIAAHAGFNSRSAFYRHFKEHYGMTPVEFRRLASAL